MTTLNQLKTTDNRIKILESMNIHSLEDIISHYPYRYEVIEEKYPTIEDDHIVIEATIISPVKIFFKGRMSRMSFQVEDKYLRLYTVTIFNRHFLRQYLNPSTTITIIGKCQNDKITASDIKIKSLEELKGIVPIYSIKEGMTQKAFQQYIKKSLTILKNQIESYVPEEMLIKHSLIHKETALWNVHFPSQENDIKQGLKFLKYEEFLKFQLTMQIIKDQRIQETGVPKSFDINKLQEFILSLPFKLTTDQQKVVKEILKDLRSPQTMYRFLQGDVGSGKTVVSAIGMYASYLAGYQSALMAPTEILAKQHYDTLINFFKDTPLKVSLLTGSLSVKEKEMIYESLLNGDIDIIVGTHALFQDKVEYRSLGLVITDEQHRFGVRQRKALRDKGNQVDFLVMSATPIPRTLAMSLYGDMDVSTITSKPSGRQDIITQYVKGSSMKPILQHLKDYLSSGGQCYVICPLVEDSENIEAKSASQIASAMASYFKDTFKVGLLHGQLHDDQKELIMKQFQNNEIQILVSTTVVEVGVDVKNANMMVIYNAERFGLSQLHQLRGRIGRSDKEAYCYLMSSSTSVDAIDRLKYMEKTSDGFEISQYDLQIRGPGEVLGQRQSGLPSFLVADIFKDFPILQVARDDAMIILERYQDSHDYQQLVDKIKENLKVNNDYID